MRGENRVMEFPKLSSLYKFSLTYRSCISRASSPNSFSCDLPMSPLPLSWQYYASSIQFFSRDLEIQAPLAACETSRIDAGKHRP